MRTSVNIPDALLEQARARAAAERNTVTDLIVEGLRARLAEPPHGSSARVTLPTRNLGRAFVDISDNRGVRDLLDEDDTVRAR